MNLSELKNISWIIIDEDNIYSSQKKLGEFLDKIDKNKSDLLNKKQHIFKLIEQRMFRYAVRIRDEFGLKTENEIKDRFYIIVNDITNHCFDMIEKSADINQEDINILHTKLFPKWLWWQTKWPGWRAVKVLYKTWEFRKHREFRLYNEKEYDYVNPDEIEKSTKILNDYINHWDEHILIKIILYLLFIWKTHPYYNWNWTVYIMLIWVLLLKNWYSVPKWLAQYLQSISENNILLNADNWNYEPLIKWFLELFETELINS